MPFDKEALHEGYATTTIPAIVREHIAHVCFFDRTTVEQDTTGRVNEYATFANEGARIAFKKFFATIESARKGKSEPQTKAVSETAEESA